MNQGKDADDFRIIYNELIEERDKLQNEINFLRRDLDNSTLKQNGFDRQIHEKNEEIQSLHEKLTQAKQENIKEAKKREQIQLELKTNQENFEYKNTELKAQIVLCKTQHQEIQKSHEQVRKLKEDNVRLTKDNQILQIHFDEIQSQLKEVITTHQKNIDDREYYRNESKKKDDEIIQLRKEYEKEQKKTNDLEKNLRSVKNQINENDQEHKHLHSTILLLQQDTDQFKKRQNQYQKQIETLTREREQLNKTHQIIIANNQKQIEQMQNVDQSRRSLEQDIIHYQEEANKQRNIILILEKERDRYINEATQSASQILELMGDVKKRELEIFNQNKTISELEIHAKQQQSLYETARTDRNFYSKNLNESKDEIDEIQRKSKIISHQIDQFKQEVQIKEQNFVNLQIEYNKIKKNKEDLVLNIEQLKQELIRKEQMHTNQQIQYKTLDKELSKTNNKTNRQTKQLQLIISERNIVGSQLIRRNDELALLYEKVKIQNSTLYKGEIQYKARLEDIRILKLELKKLHHEKYLLQNQIPNINELKQELFHSQRDLTRERIRCRALEDELENPMNIHRWRKLEITDPSTFELIQKIQFLQKSLIQKTEEVQQKELLIQEKEKLYDELKRILARQPGPELVKQLSIFQETLKVKTTHIKCLISEMNMYKTEIDNYKYATDKLNQELNEVRQKYFQQKKKESQTKEKERLAQTEQAALPDLVQQNRSNGQVRFAGGGFKLQSTPKSSIVNI
ncbi:unnamed protein product [Adineta steineri]|uniref:Cilia- and flagella-associated protein 58 central coiled coil domain-containing protein n=2 Tax=Adineta steineri TaxID=433720 RepID=A0A815GGT2_9BILA|nr:unnamed protein product [Adineta steineri]CAF4038188.1 unnamed protein product [Adineta steineri]